MKKSIVLLTLLVIVFLAIALGAADHPRTCHPDPYNEQCLPYPSPREPCRPGQGGLTCKIPPLPECTHNKPCPWPEFGAPL